MKLAATFYDRVRAASEAAAERLDASGAEVAIVLGSGLGAVGERLEDSRSAPYATLPGFPETTVVGHPGRLIAGRLAGKKVLVLCGRVHGYEGPWEGAEAARFIAALQAETFAYWQSSDGTVAPTPSD